jgi:hypothetical protein
MGSLQNIVNVQISRQTSVPSRAGFGTGAFLANDTALSKPARSYASVAEMTDDAQLAGSLALAAGAAYFGQQISPPKLTILRQQLVNVNEEGALIFDADLVTDNSVVVTVDGVPLAAIPFNNDNPDTLDDIATAIQALTQVTTAVQNGGVDGVDIVFGDFVDHTVSAVVTLGATQATALYTESVVASAVQTLEEALTAAIGYDNDWYALGMYSRVKADIEDVSDFIQGIGSSNPKLYFAQNADPLILDVGDSTDIASVLQAKAAFRTSVWYHSDDTEYMPMALMGGQLPFDPGSITWAYKTLSLVTVDSLTSAQKSSCHGKACNTYDTVSSVNITEEGKVSDSPFEWIDVIRGVDWLSVNIAADLFQLLLTSPKVPYTTAGLSSVRGLVLNRLGIAVARGILSPDTPPTCFVPDILDVPAADKGNRVLNGVTFTGVLAGAIQKINVLGTVTL